MLFIWDSVGGIANREIHGKKSKKLFKSVCSLENLFLAWNKFRKGKRSRWDVMKYQRSLEDNLFELRGELHSGNYRHGKYIPFIIYDPKRRLIHKATVKDRVVHQAIAQIIEPLFEKQFIFDSYSCRKEKGTHAAVRRLHTFLRRVSKNDTRTVYALKCDIKKFFASVDHEILRTFIVNRISESRLIDLLDRVIESFEYSQGKGIPLGNLTSQLFANIYMHELDYFMKFVLREKYYVRYCDDFVLVNTSRGYLENLTDTINSFLDGQMKMFLHPQKVSIRTWTQGVDFLGYVLLPHAIVLRTKTKQRMLQRINENNVNSYLGFCGHACAYEVGRVIRNKVWLA